MQNDVLIAKALYAADSQKRSVDGMLFLKKVRVKSFLFDAVDGIYQRRF